MESRLTSPGGFRAIESQIAGGARHPNRPYTVCNQKSIHAVARELQVKGAAFAELAVYPHPASVALRDGFDNRQPEAGAFDL